MCDLNEVKEAVKTIKSEGNNNIVLLHCTSCYPTYPEDANLNSIRTLIETFQKYQLGTWITLLIRLHLVQQCQLELK